MDATGRHELPGSDSELAKLAYLLGYSPEQLTREARETFEETRARFDRLFDSAGRA